MSMQNMWIYVGRDKYITCLQPGNTFVSRVCVCVSMCPSRNVAKPKHL